MSVNALKRTRAKTGAKMWDARDDGGSRGWTEDAQLLSATAGLAQWPLKTENKRHCSALFRIDICEYNIDARRGYAARRDLKRRLKIKGTHVDARASARSNCAHVNIDAVS